MRMKRKKFHQKKIEESDGEDRDSPKTVRRKAIIRIKFFSSKLLF